MPAKPVITGIAFAADITAPTEVTEPATWGWWSGSSINIIRADSKAAAYAAARRAAGRRKTTVQIYANTGGGWTQVDVMPAPPRGLCEWWPDGDGPATGRDGEYCPNEAAWSGRELAPVRVVRRAAEVQAAAPPYPSRGRQLQCLTHRSSTNSSWPAPWMGWA